ncbi:CoA pyrophosphatase [uncultured Thermanaerothrix sp.]|uniref:NUDIX hydrolase n=1 Tax=uncultured Thermanaerothrix sp. TaxID=1195149 RepID=UPI002633333A|nr:CoA pyrophosphatase [uncultured Thermanaerothrix sp.]
MTERLPCDPADPAKHLTIEIIRQRLAEFQAVWSVSDPLASVCKATLRPAAVLVPLVWEAGEWHLLFTRRSSHVQNHRGQVAFPGGAIEAEDPSVESAALRETWEEIGVEAARIMLLGRLPALVSVTHYLIYPVVGKMDWPVSLRLSKEEVERVFTIPLAWLAQPAHLQREILPAGDGTRREVLFYTPYQGERVWGVSAYIVYLLLQALKLVV